VQKFARDGGAGRRKLTTRKVLEGSRRVVLHLRASLVAPPPPRDEDQ
jgi:hypothetical protein